MNPKILGDNIASLRKKKNATQEELAAFVGVSPQAVSKWENGGAPDCFLLSKIADFFGVSADALFGRTVDDQAGIEEILTAKIRKEPTGKRLATIDQLCWTMQLALFDMFDPKEESDRSIANLRSPKSKVYSEWQDEKEGMTIVSMDENLPYFLLMPKKIAARDLTADVKEFSDFFRLLSDRTILEALILFLQVQNDYFTAKWIAEKLGISEEKAEEVLAVFLKLHYITKEKVKTDNTEQWVYSYCLSNAVSFPALLLLASRMIKGNEGFCFQRNTGGPFMK